MFREINYTAKSNGLLLLFQCFENYFQKKKKVINSSNTSQHIDSNPNSNDSNLIFNNENRTFFDRSISRDRENPSPILRSWRRFRAIHCSSSPSPWERRREIKVRGADVAALREGAASPPTAADTRCDHMSRRGPAVCAPRFRKSHGHRVIRRWEDARSLRGGGKKLVSFLSSFSALVFIFIRRIYLSSNYEQLCCTYTCNIYSK